MARFFDAEYSRIKEKVLGTQFTRSISYFCRSQLMMFSGCDEPERFNRDAPDDSQLVWILALFRLHCRKMQYRSAGKLF